MFIKNWLWFTVAVIMLGAAVQGYWMGQWKAPSLAVLYATANFIISTMDN